MNEELTREVLEAMVKCDTISKVQGGKTCTTYLITLNTPPPPCKRKEQSQRERSGTWIAFKEWWAESAECMYKGKCKG